MSMNLDGLLKQLSRLYADLPAVPCKGCGECCVSPTITLLEFIFLFDGLFKTFTTSEIQSLLLSPIQFHGRSEGNLQCKFLSKQGRCIIHPCRSMACRLHGLPVIEKLNIPGQENCLKIREEQTADIPLDELEKWLENLTHLNSELLEYYTAPFFIAGFNIECWLSVVYDPFLDMDPFIKIKKILNERFPQLALIPYQDQTNLKEKTDKILFFSEFLKQGVSEELIELLDSISRDYPYTGTYFLQEAEKYKIEILKRFQTDK